MNKNELIWYVCYGSNLLLDRFMSYLTGQPLPSFNLKAGKRCDNTNLPLKTKQMTIPYRLYFGYKSKTWDGGGVCFIDSFNKSLSLTICKSYLITREQYEHIRDRESRELYDCELDLGDIDGIKAVTITSSFEQVHQKPSDLYFRIVKEGLMSCELSEKEAIEYINERLSNNLSLQMAHFMLEKLENMRASAWVIAESLDIKNFQKTYKIIKENPNISQEELIDELDLKI